MTELAPIEVQVVKQEERNGVVRPKNETACGRIWAVADEMSAALGGPVACADLLAKLTVQGYVEATIRTQYARWRKFYGVEGRIISEQKMQAEAAKAQAKADKEAAKAQAKADREAKAAEKKAAKEQAEAERKAKAEAAAKAKAEKAEAAAKEKAAKAEQAAKDKAAKAKAKAEADQGGAK